MPFRAKPEWPSPQSAGLARALEHAACDFVRPYGTVAQDALHVVGIGRELGPAHAIGREIIPIVLEQRLLQVAITEPASTKAFFVIARNVSRCDETQQLDGEIFVRIGLWFLWWS